MSDATIASATGIPVAFIRAIRAVESGGDSSAVRFEPHVFWRMRLGLPGPPHAATGPQIKAAMSDAQHAQVPYTPGNTDWRAAHGLAPCRISRSASCSALETNRFAFDRAFALDPTNAIRATSFGTFQILGGDLLALYGNDPARAIAAFRAAPAAVSEQLLVHYLQVTKPRAIPAAVRGDVLSFVQAYNGCRDATDCAAYVTKFRRALLEPAADAAGGGLLLAVAAGLGYWWWRRR